MNAATLLSAKPYLIRAIYEWCLDQGFTPHIACVVDENVRVPAGYARDGQIVLNIGPEATHHFVIGNEAITFQARFGGVAHSLYIPVGHVAAIYAAHNGQGMAFEPDLHAAVAAAQTRNDLDEGKGDARNAPRLTPLKPVAGNEVRQDEGEDDPPPAPHTPRRPHLTVVK
ncbi:MAG: ClpXP protease specificity-enhancing factor [Rhodocyclaceae bacterium]|nr:ClpXP protease specificity-enhancing factor [Rhodocyclaceae bacterium]MBR4736875.1 ClpXP protease specificity-enhancing factor [Rhodocyclaceae bacterium]